jgi:hypothetical protein
MDKKLPASVLTAIAISIVFVDVSSARPGPRQREFRLYRAKPGIDERMVKQPPRIGDEKMLRKAPENIDDGIFGPNRVFRKYPRTAQPKVHQK